MRQIHAMVAALACGALACGPGETGADRTSGRKPNIVLIMADDLGAETLGCYGNTVHSTPRLAGVYCGRS